METIIIILSTSIFTALLMRTYLKRVMPKLLEGVTQIFAGSIQETFKDPNVKRAMSILGNESGKSRATAANMRIHKEAETELAQNILANATPEIQIVLDRFAPDFLEKYPADVLLSLAQKYAPMIQQFLNPKGQPLFGKQKSKENFGWSP